MKVASTVFQSCIVMAIVCAGGAALAADARSPARPAQAGSKAAPETTASKPKTTTSAQKGSEVRLEDGSKVRAYSFGALDLEGKLRTPQLLYFLGRVRLELDSTTELRRSFIPELKKTADEEGL